MVEQASTSSDNHRRLSVKSLVASVGAIAISKVPGAKSKGRTKRTEVGLNIDFSTTLFG